VLSKVYNQASMSRKTRKAPALTVDCVVAIAIVMAVVATTGQPASTPAAAPGAESSQEESEIALAGGESAAVPPTPEQERVSEVGCASFETTTSYSPDTSDAGKLESLDEDELESSSQGPASSMAYTGDPGAASLAQRGGVGRVQVPQAWQIAGGGEPTIVAILDTGIDADNEELGGRVVGEVNFTASPTSNDLHGHGTHMAGTVAAIAPNCRLLNVKVADDRGWCQASAVARGIEWAVNHGARVINLSLCTEASPELERAVDYAWSRGAVVVAAAGNEGGSSAAYPAYYAGCLAVAATNESDSLVALSNHGDGVDVAAPGFKVYSALSDDQYSYETGTSPAAARVSGVAALVFSVAVDGNGNGMVNDEVRQAIESTCSWVGVNGVGNGLVNAFEAAQAAASPD
jgi:subtilisin family serine protease